MISFPILMVPGKKRVVAAAAVIAAALIVLLAQSFAPQKAPRLLLAPDSVAKAVATRDNVLLDLSLSEYLDVNQPGPNGRTALLIATQQHDRALIDRLLAAGADVDKPDTDGFTPVMVAAVGGDPELLRLLVSRSKNLDARDSEGRTAAHHAILARRYEILETLLEAGEQAGSTQDLLPIACEVGDARVLSAVLERSPGGLEWSSQTREALTLALRGRDDALVSLLLAKHVGPPTLEGRNIPLLAQAIANDDLEVCRALLAAGADPNTTIPLGADKPFLAELPSPLRDYVKLDPGITMLMIAAGMGKAEFVRTLLDAGASKNSITSRYKMLALYFAARAGKSKCIQMLLGSGAAPDKLRIEISLRAQRARLIRDGTPIFETQCSTGRDGFATRPGEYVITDKRRDHVSSIYKVPMPYFMRLNCLDFGMHQGAVPRYPASHGCIRLPADAAKKFFSELPVGTVVMIN
ncbi:MAG TPA: ankyrin repeat domain-containing protein [Chthoniobacterales bacterium]|nr:ankyrin repeat domain-containing protein [Chthoniobacterales bacterium]